jgi:hypothetical protein
MVTYSKDQPAPIARVGNSADLCRPLVVIQHRRPCRATSCGQLSLGSLSRVPRWNSQHGDQLSSSDVRSAPSQRVPS